MDDSNTTDAPSQKETMIQDFSVKGGPQAGRDHVPLLRAELARRKLDGFIIPHEDEYQNEYLPAATDRLAWLTGFTGSAGAAVVMAQKAVMLVDGRYTLQVQGQVDASLFAFDDLVEIGIAGWLRTHAKPGDVIGYDPKLHSPDALASISAAIQAAGATLQPQADNPLDAVWKDRPSMPQTPLSVQGVEFSGQPHGEKIAQIAKALKKINADAAVITAPASIAWLFNIRGQDVACSPLPLSTALIREDGTAELFVSPDKVTEPVRAHFGNSVAIRPEGALSEALETLKGKTVSLDPGTASAWLFSAVEHAGGTICRAPDPCALPRACKNTTEIEGARRAHIRDGAALSRFLCFMASEEAQSGEMNEISAAQKLETFRHETGALQDLSFESISGAGANGAIVHYRVTTASNASLLPGSLYLIDSGGQYRDGTTDVTRTLAIGTPSEEMCDRFTRVLKGHIALARIRFPQGTTGTHLDILARAALWEAGLDYAHGTGHGVGAYLGVHEGPQRIARAWNDTPLMEGMIVSNEPGYYKTGAFGIRIENLQVVCAAEPIEGGETPMLGFETLTLAPIERRLIKASMLDRAELTWLNNYHARVLAIHEMALSKDEADWLKNACAPL
jgi:Xaa-Pro aminopeptidase